MLWRLDKLESSEVHSTSLVPTPVYNDVTWLAKSMLCECFNHRGDVRAKHTVDGFVLLG